MECTADLLLTYVWDKISAGTASNNTENGLKNLSAPCVRMGRHCLWDSEEQHRGYIAQLVLSSLHCGTRLPLEQGGAQCW